MKRETKGRRDSRVFRCRVVFSSGSRQVIGNNAINRRAFGEREKKKKKKKEKRKEEEDFSLRPRAVVVSPGDTNRCRITDTVFKPRFAYPAPSTFQSSSKGTRCHPLEKRSERARLPAARGDAKFHSKTIFLDPDPDPDPIRSRRELVFSHANQISFFPGTIDAALSTFPLR